MYRTRPGLTFPPRAIRALSDTTSSMPSRAVLCAVVYTYLVYASVNFNDKDEFFAVTGETLHWSVLGFMVLLAALVSSYARIFLGMHYPSDCLVGFFTGLLVLFLSSLCSRYVPLLDCPSCTDHHCYADSGSLVSLFHGPWGELNWLPSGLILCLGTVLILLSTLPPVSFWFKTPFIFGTSLFCFTYRVLFLCPNSSHSAALSPSPYSISEKIVLGTASFGLTLILAFGSYPLSMKFPSKLVTLCVFMVILVVEIGWVLLWRVS